MTAFPDSAECLCPMPDGRVVAVTATRRPRANRAEVKCVVLGAPALAERMQAVVLLARHTEPHFDSRDQVVLSMDMLPGQQNRGWELAAVLADRMARGRYPGAGHKVYAYGWSDAWQLGRVQGDAAAVLPRLHGFSSQAGGGAAAAFVLGGAAPEPVDATTHVSPLYISHLGGLRGQADPAASVSSARAWFPLHSGGLNDSLGWVEVSVRPLAPGHEPCEEEDSIAVPGLDAAEQLAVRQALAGARHFDARGLARWRTAVRFGQPRFQGASYQLALVMADRLARGREFVPRGRLIASGCSSAWHAGRVDSVEAREPKMELIARHAAAGDRILLPLAWREPENRGAADQAGLTEESVRFAAGLKAAGASVAWIDRIGII